MKARRLVLCAALALLACQDQRGEYPPEALAAVALRVGDSVGAGESFAQDEPRTLLVSQVVGYPDSTTMDRHTIGVLEKAGLRTAPQSTRSERAAMLEFWRVAPDSVRNRWHIVGSIFFYDPDGSYSNEMSWIVECRRIACRVVEETDEGHSHYSGVEQFDTWGGEDEQAGGR